MLNSATDDVAAVIREKIGGHGADSVFNIVGSPYFEIADNAMAKQARQIFISTFGRAVPFDILNFFHGRHKYIGIDTLVLFPVEGARIFGKLKLFPINPATTYRFGDAAKA